jgi:hypothetical protein
LQKSEGPGTAAPGPFGPEGYIRPATFLAPILAPQLRLSILASGRRNRPGLFRSKRPINGALCFLYCLGLRRGSACFRMVRVERDRPFPDMPPGTLNDAVLDFAIFHADLRTCGVARLSRVSIPSGIARSRKGRCYSPMGGPTRWRIFGDRVSGAKISAVFACRTPRYSPPVHMIKLTQERRAGDRALEIRRGILRTP